VNASSSRAIRWVVLAAVAALMGRDAAAAEFTVVAPCPPSGAVVSVLTRAHELWLCIEGFALARFPIALGRGGVDKREQGDERTPLGSYELGTPRRSSLYGTFIPIAYPTVEQAALGYTGDALGIHGPPRRKNAAEYPLVEVDWTRGCIATATDEAVGTIADFVRERRPIVTIR
jgi:hypothetical protein